MRNKTQMEHLKALARAAARVPAAQLRKARITGTAAAAKEGRALEKVTRVRDDGTVKECYALAALRREADTDPAAQGNAQAAAPESAFEKAAALVKLELADRLAAAPFGAAWLRTLLEIVVEELYHPLSLRKWWEAHGRALLKSTAKEAPSWTELQKRRGPQEWLRLYVRGELDVPGAGPGLDQEVVAMKRQLADWLLPELGRFSDYQETQAVARWAKEWGVDATRMLAESE